MGEGWRRCCEAASGLGDTMEHKGLMGHKGDKVVARHPRRLQLDSVLRCQRAGREGRACCRVCVVVLYGCIFSRLAGRIQEEIMGHAWNSEKCEADGGAVL
jgi:hypothetical protein